MRSGHIESLLNKLTKLERDLGSSRVSSSGDQAGNGLPKPPKVRNLLSFTVTRIRGLTMAVSSEAYWTVIPGEKVFVCPHRNLCSLRCHV